MLLETKEYLRNHPCYLIAAILLAKEGEPEILIKITGNEKAGFDLLKTANDYIHFASNFNPEDFPLSLNDSSLDIIKLPERLAGYLLANKKFYALTCPKDPQKIYDEEWLKGLDKKDQEILKKKYEEIVAEPASVKPSSPSESQKESPKD